MPRLVPVLLLALVVATTAHRVKNAEDDLEPEEESKLGEFAEMEITIHSINTVTRVSAVAVSTLNLLALCNVMAGSAVLTTVALPLGIMSMMVGAWEFYKYDREAEKCGWKIMIDTLTDLWADHAISREMVTRLSGAELELHKDKLTLILEDNHESAKATVKVFCTGNYPMLQGTTIQVPSTMERGQVKEHSSFHCQPDQVQSITSALDASLQMSREAYDTHDEDPHAASGETQIDEADTVGPHQILLQTFEVFERIALAVTDALFKTIEQHTEAWKRDPKTEKSLKQQMLINSMLGILTCGPLFFANVGEVTQISSHFSEVLNDYTQAASMQEVRGVRTLLSGKDVYVASVQSLNAAELIQADAVLQEHGVNASTPEGRHALEDKLSEVIRTLNASDEETKSTFKQIKTMWLQKRLVNLALEEEGTGVIKQTHAVEQSALVSPTALQRITGSHGATKFLFRGECTKVPGMGWMQKLIIRCLPGAADCQAVNDRLMKTGQPSMIFTSNARAFVGSEQVETRLIPNDVTIKLVSKTKLSLVAGASVCHDKAGLVFPAVHDTVEFESARAMCHAVKAMVVGGQQIDALRSNGDILAEFFEAFSSESGCEHF